MSGTSLSPNRRVFLDSAGFLALVNPHDTFHQVARDMWSQLSLDRWRTFTTNFVLAETHALFLARLGYPHATAFLREMEQSSASLIRVALRDEERARQVIYDYDDKTFSFTDATSFAVMERLGITHAFTFDQHFAQFGFQTLPAR